MAWNKHIPNARKGKANRVTLSIRIKPEIKAFIATQAKKLGISQGELIDAWGEYFKKNDTTNQHSN